MKQESLEQMSISDLLPLLQVCKWLRSLTQNTIQKRIYVFLREWVGDERVFLSLLKVVSEI